MSERIKPMVPNAVTMLALVCGVSSMNMAMWGNWKMSVIFVMLSCVFDFFDGKVARLLGVSSRFGAELDSLSDFVSFGVAPGFLMYNWSMDSTMRLEALKDIVVRPEAGGLNWGLALFLAVCCASRLARFNSMLDERQPSYWTHFFMGVPAPAGGFLAMMPLIFWLATGTPETSVFKTTWFVSIFVAFAGVMMASRIPTLCLKHLHFGKTMRSVVWIVLLALIAGVFSCPWMTLSIVGVGYVVSIPVGVCVFLRFKAAARDAGETEE